MNPDGTGYFKQISKAEKQHQSEEKNDIFPVYIKYHNQYTCKRKTEKCRKDIRNKHSAVVKSGFSYK